MKRLLILILLTTSLSQAQNGMIIVADYTGHEITTPDSLSKATVKEYIGAMERSGINYEPRLRNINGVKIIGRDRTFVADIKKGWIRLNKRLNKFPHTKRVVILQQLGVNQGMRLKGQVPYVGGKFRVNKRNEELFELQENNNGTIRKLIKKLE